jgi:hypothetical protein
LFFVILFRLIQEIAKHGFISLQRVIYIYIYIYILYNRPCLKHLAWLQAWKAMALGMASEGVAESFSSHPSWA